MRVFKPISVDEIESITACYMKSLESKEDEQQTLRLNTFKSLLDDHNKDPEAGRPRNSTVSLKKETIKPIVER